MFYSFIRHSNSLILFPKKFEAYMTIDCVIAADLNLSKGQNRNRNL